MPFYKNDLEDHANMRFNYINPQYKFVLLPKRCYISGKMLWLEYAYRKTILWTGPGEPIVEHRWYSTTEFIIDQLKQ